ncbi:MAG: SulP family inorganic anion transporter [Verrucomicrobiales bacterium]
MNARLKKFQRAIRSLKREVVGFIFDNNLDPFPIRRGLRHYSGWKFRQDLRSGLNVALLAFPQGMAYAVVAGLPIHYGITCSAVAAIVAPFLTSSRHTILGPTNATALMIFSYFAVYPHPNKLEIMPLLVFMVGVLLVLGAYFRIAELVQYVSRSVVVGYITGAAVLIIANQGQHLFGIYAEAAPVPGESVAKARTFFAVLWNTVGHLGEADWKTVSLALLTFTLYFFLRRKFSALPIFAITLLIVSLFSWLLTRIAPWEVPTFESFRVSDLRPAIPRFSDQGILSDVSRLFGVAFAVAFLASLENSVMSKTLASRTGDRPDVNQDMLGVGAANLATAFLSGMPASGSLTRSALNFASGALTQMSSIISGLLCVIGALLLGPLIGYIPKSCLAALVICIAASLINRRQIRIALFATRSDAIVVLTTFVATLVTPLNVAIFLGVGASIVLYLRKASQPFLVEYEFGEEGDLREARGARQNPSISIVHVEGELFFGAAELFRTQIQRTCQDPNLRIIILRMKNARHLDATSVMALEELIQFLRSKGRDLIISGATKEVYRVLRNAGMIEGLGRENFFLYTPHNPNISTRNALIRAQELLGTDKADIRIYYDPSHDKKD